MGKNSIKDNIKIREVLMQCTFQMEINKNGNVEQIDFLLFDEKLSEKNKEYIKNIFVILLDNLDNIDDLINKYSKEWASDRIPKADLAILRLAICELVFIKEFHGGIIINDAVNMAKKFSDEDSFKYINGILGNIYRNEL